MTRLLPQRGATVLASAFVLASVAVLGACEAPIPDARPASATALDAPDVAVMSPHPEVRPTWSWGAVEAAVLYRVRLDGGPWVETRLTWFTPDIDLAEGPHALDVASGDGLGGWSAPSRATTDIDLTPPAVPVVHAVASPISESMAVFQWAPIPDAVGYQARLAGSATWRDLRDARVVFGPLGERTHGVEVVAIDAVGHRSEPGHATVVIDQTAPDAPRVTVAASTGELRPTWRWEAASDVVGYELRLDDATVWRPHQDASWTPAADLTPGGHALFVRAVDAAGNRSDVGHAVTLIDREGPEAPRVSVTSPTTSALPTWTWSAPAGAVAFRYAFAADGPWTATTAREASPEAPLAEGEHTLFVQAEDAAGNRSAPGIGAVVVDWTAPPVTIISAPGLTTEARPTWRWLPVPGADLYRVRLDEIGTGWAEVTEPTFTPAVDLPDGVHTLHVEAADRAGNRSAAALGSAIIDRTAPPAPSVSITSPTSSARPAWSWAPVAGAVAYRYRVDGGPWSPAESSPLVARADLSEGPHTLELASGDAAGNWSAPSSATVVIDRSPPRTPAVHAPSETWDPRPEWVWNADPEAVMWRAALDDGSGWIFTGAPRFVPAYDVPDGELTLYVQARDAAGNWSASGAATVRVARRYAANPDYQLVAVSDAVSVATDLDGDGAMDLVVAGHGVGGGARIDLYFGDIHEGGLTRREAPGIEAVASPRLALADLDGDGDPDLVLAGRRDDRVGGVLARVYRNDGLGGFRLVRGAGIDGGGDGFIAAGDLDGDGAVDLVLGGATQDGGGDDAALVAWLNDGSGRFRAAAGPRRDGLYDAAGALADLDGDGDLDLVVAGLSRAGGPMTRTFANDGSGAFHATASPIALPAFDAPCLQILDVDGSGAPDLIVSGFDASDEPGAPARVEAARSIGDGTFDAVRKLDVPFSAVSGLFAGDVDGDGVPDLVVVSADRGRRPILWVGDGAGGFARDRSAVFPAVAGGAPTVADLDGDGLGDLVFTGIDHDGAPMATIRLARP